MKLKYFIRRQQNTRKFVKRPDDIEAAGKSGDETRKCLSVENVSLNPTNRPNTDIPNMLTIHDITIQINIIAFND